MDMVRAAFPSKSDEKAMFNYFCRQNPIQTLLLCCAVFVSACVSAQSVTELPPVRLYTSVMATPNPKIAFIDRTREVLEEALAPRKVIFRAVLLDELDQLIARREVDLVIAGAGFYRRHARDGLRDIATLVSPREPDPNYAVGATVVTRSDRTDINTLADLHGKSITANSPYGFQGHLMVLAEAAALGFNPDRFFKRVDYTGMDLLASLDLLRNGKVDAVTLTSCLIETAEAENGTPLEGLKIVGEKPQNQIACRVSTDLYPNWSLMIGPGLDVDALHRIVRAVHSMQASADGIEWGLASDYDRVDAMFKTLRFGPYAYLRDWTVKRFFQEYGHWAALLFLCVLGLLGHSVRVSQVVRLRTRELRESLERQKELTAKVTQLSNRYEAICRAATVAQISSLVAHELSQPLGGILLYASGLKTLILQQAATIDKALRQRLIDVTDRISARAEKADAIVTAVRDHARNRTTHFESTDLSRFVSEVKHHFCTAEGVPEDIIELRLTPEPITMSIVRFDIELALVNLLRNAWQIVVKTPEPKIVIAVDLIEGGATVSVSDNGPPVSDETLEKLADPMHSIKADGLGLGLAIVRSIMERHYGRLAVTRNAQGSLRAALIFPNCAGDNGNRHA